QRRAFHLRLMADLSRSLGEQGKTGENLDTPLLAGFLAGRRAAGCREGLSMLALRPLMEYLRGTGAVPPGEPAPPSGPAEEAIAEYASYLRSERGLAAVPVEREPALIRPFLAGRVRDGLGDLETLTAADVQAFVLGCARSSPPVTVQRTGTALRSLLRFLHLRGVTASPLAGAVPAAANWKLSGLPRHLTQDEAARMLDSCDLATVTGQRDRAVRPLTRGAVTQIAARASQRCGLGTVFAHRLRHTAATGMLRAGASLEEIGQVLRHREVSTTAIYAKVDYDRLRGLARPWPGDAA